MSQPSSAKVSREEQEELEAVLRAKILVRSPSVLRVAEYIGQKYLVGEGEGIKEYNIAIEALGKPAEFDQKRDSIVRVEVHRLRKKLDDYYETEGAGHKLRMVIDPGQYVPRFVPNTSPKAVEAEIESEPVAPEAPPSVETPRRSPKLIAAAAGLIAVAAGLTIWWIVAARSGAMEDTVRIIAGAPGIQVIGSSVGPQWRADRWFHGGANVFGGDAAPGTPEIPLDAQRQGEFDYGIPLSPAPHELRLYFSPRLGKAGEAPPSYSRRFSVAANGAPLLDALEPSASHENRNRTVIRVFRDIRPAADGKLHLSFRSGQDTAYVTAIEITPGVAGRLEPVRILARSSPYTEPGGRMWDADRFFTAGITAIRSQRVHGNDDPNLFSGERYGDFKYEIPVSRGRYGLKLYFAETWFGPTTGGGGVGSRRFDVEANGVPLLQDFDIFREAGGSYRSVTREFHGLEPNADGYIILSFVSRVNHACLNALELSEEPR